MSTSKIVEISEKSIDLLDGTGQPMMKKRKLFLQFAMIVVERTPQKTDTETFLAHSIREKLDAADVDHASEIELEQSEIEFLKGGIRRLREKDEIVGTGYYELVHGLNEAKDRPKLKLEQKGK